MFATLFVMYWRFLTLFLFLTAVFWVLFIIMFFVEHNTVLSTHYQELQGRWNEEPLYTGYLLLLIGGGLCQFFGFFMVMLKDSFQWGVGFDPGGNKATSR